METVKNIKSKVIKPALIFVLIMILMELDIVSSLLLPWYGQQNLYPKVMSKLLFFKQY